MRGRKPERCGATEAGVISLLACDYKDGAFAWLCGILSGTGLAFQGARTEPDGAVGKEAILWRSSFDLPEPRDRNSGLVPAGQGPVPREAVHQNYFFPSRSRFQR